jgi:hypothetical protein
MLDLKEQNLHVFWDVFGERVVVALQPGSNGFGILFFEQCDEGTDHHALRVLIQHGGDHPQHALASAGLHGDHDVAGFGHHRDQSVHLRLTLFLRSGILPDPSDRISNLSADLPHGWRRRRRSTAVVDYEIHQVVAGCQVYGILARRRRRRRGRGAELIAAGQADDVHVHRFDGGPMSPKSFEAPRRLLAFVYQLADGLQAMLAVPVSTGHDWTCAGLRCSRGLRLRGAVIVGSIN